MSVKLKDDTRVFYDMDLPFNAMLLEHQACGNTYVHVGTVGGQPCPYCGDPCDYPEGASW